MAAYVPHSALRVYVMGERGARREDATPQDIETMVAFIRNAMQAGAIGFATSNIDLHRRIDGVPIASYQTAEPELAAIARDHYRAAAAILRRKPPGHLLAPRLMEAVYAQILRRMEQAGWVPPRTRIKVNKPALLFTVLRLWLLR